MGTTILKFTRMTAFIAHIWFGTQTSLGRITNGIAGTIIVQITGDNGYTSDSGIWIWYGVIGTSAGKAAVHVDTFGSIATFIATAALINIHTFGVGISREA